MRITETIEPSYFIVTAIGFVILSFIQYKKFGKTIETKFLSVMAVYKFQDGKIISLETGAKN